MSEFPDHPFWDFSLDVYMSKGVGAAFLELQRAHELDVNILLFCMWVGASGRGSLTTEQMTALLAAVSIWHEDVVRALRAIRVRMKGGIGDEPTQLSESLRQRIQKIEIDCEHAEQLMMTQVLDMTVNNGKTASEKLVDAASNISTYFATFGSISASDKQNLCFVLRVAFPNLNDLQPEKAFENIQ